MVEPSDNTQAVFEKAIDTAKKLHHEYLTIEHLLFAMLADDGFHSVIQGFGANADDLKNDLTDYLQNKCAEITVTDVVVKPKKTQALNVYSIVRLHKYCLTDVSKLNQLISS